ncbi:MAG: hypothetical protein JRG92_22390 [Deltaproteobacteria bacterium]|jgi:hypothetical protein|nr:hypothetical protein [Deltaproteobacteria bacterium]MBW2386388.1 hypothetical protein [Deltaproteobacteria bacterium]
MLLLREEHAVEGAHEDAFEATMRDEWLPALARGDDARLYYYLNLAHGSGLSYRVVTYSVIPDGAAWGRLVERVAGGDLAALSEKLDGLRHEVTAGLYISLPWSPMGELELADIPAEPVEHDLTLFMEDTVHPREGRLEEYVERAGAHYAVEFDEQRSKRPQLLEIQAAWRAAYGSQRRREVILWQKVVRPEQIAGLLTREVPARYKQPGLWMLDALEWRDQWQSRLLRTSSWSPGA